MRVQRDPRCHGARQHYARAMAVELCVEFFFRSDARYTCAAVVIETVKPELQRLAGLPDFRGLNVNTHYTLNRVADEVHRRWKERQE